MVVQDLAWTRTFHIRMAIASLFDDPSALAMLQEIEGVQIIGHPDNWSGVALLASWLASQSGWESHGKTETGYQFKREDGTMFQLVITLDPQSAPVGLVELQGGGTRGQGSGKAGEKHLELALDAPQHELRQIAPADSDQVVGLVAEQLSRGGQNSLYQKIWPFFFELLES